MLGIFDKLGLKYQVMGEEWCCGSGGGVKSAFDGFALWSATERLKEAKEAGAEALVSACPFCKRNCTLITVPCGTRIYVISLNPHVFGMLTCARARIGAQLCDCNCFCGLYSAGMRAEDAWVSAFASVKNCY